MIKLMHLDMFYFDYKPIFSEHEKLIFKNNEIVVLFEKNEKTLEDSNILNIKFDTLFAERLGQNWSNDEIVNALKSKKGIDRYRLFIIDPKDEVYVSFDFMIDTLAKLNYDGQSFECIAYSKK